MSLDINNNILLYELTHALIGSGERNQQTETVTHRKHFKTLDECELYVNKFLSNAKDFNKNNLVWSQNRDRFDTYFYGNLFYIKPFYKHGDSFGDKYNSNEDNDLNKLV